MNENIVTYYNERAKEYEQIYDKPERQNDLQLAGEILQGVFAGKRLLEIACGTGYWTEKISRTAHSILATDINDTVIDVAKSKSYSPAKVEFQTADIFTMQTRHKYESLFGGFIWSHINLQDLHSFIDITNSLVENGGTIVFMDNKYVEGSNLPVTEADRFGNTFQMRTLADRTMHKVLKNFPTESFIKQAIEHKARELDFINLEYFWILVYKTK